MPKFDIDLSDGRTVTIESDSEPNEDEVLSVIQSQTQAESQPASNLGGLMQDWDRQSSLIPTVSAQSTLPTTFGVNLPPQEKSREQKVMEETWGQLSPTDKLASDVSRLGREAIEGIGSTAKGFGLFTEFKEPGIIDEGWLSPRERQFREEQLARRASETPEARAQRIASNPAVQLGERISAFGERQFPTVQPESVNRPLGAILGGVGSAASFLPTAAAGPGAVMLSGAFQSGAQGYQEAKDSGASDDAAETAFVVNALGGTTEALPIARVFDRINKASGGSVGRALKDMIASGFEESAQEAFQTVLGNAAAKNLYDEERELLDGVAEAAGTGGAVGFLLSGLGIGTGAAARRIARPQQPERIPNAVQPESAQVLRPVLQSKVAQEGEVQVPTTESGAKIDETLTPQVSEFVSEFTKTEGQAKISNDSANPDMITTNATGEAVNSMSDLNALLEANVNARNRLRELRDIRGQRELTPQEASEFFRLAGTIQFPREVIERATNIGSGSQEMRRPWEKAIEPKLDWKKNPQVRQWLLDNAEKMWSDDPLIQNKATLEKGGETIEKAQEAEVLTSSIVNQVDSLKDRFTSLINSPGLGYEQLETLRLDAERLLSQQGPAQHKAYAENFFKNLEDFLDGIASKNKTQMAESGKLIKGLSAKSPFAPTKSGKSKTQYGAPVGQFKSVQIGDGPWWQIIDSEGKVVRSGMNRSESAKALKEMQNSEALSSGRAIGFFPRQSEALGLGEPALPPTVETVRQQREQEKRESGIAPGEKTTPSQGQWFAGLNPRETSSMMQNRANAFLEGKTDEQAIVDLARMAGGDPGVQLDNQAANFAIKDLLVRINAKINSTKNPVYHAEAWAQIDRLAELSRRLGAEDARSLVSRRLAYRQIDWLMPVLAFRGIVQDKWRKALGLPPGAPIAGKDTEESSKKLKLPRMDGPEMEKMRELAKRAKNEPQGVRRNKTLEEMVKLLQSQTSMSKLDLLRDVWYGSVLARVGTMLNVLAGSYATGASFTALAALDRIARLHPVQAMKIVGQFIGGTIEGTLIADQIARKGAYHLLPDAEQRMINLLSGKSGARFDNLEALLKRGNPVGVLAYTRRFMAALDYIGALGTRDSQVLYGALSRGDQESLDALDKRSDKALNQQAEQQAKTEMGPKASRAEVLVRKREILEEGVAEDIKEQSVQTARRAAQNADPRGIPGLLYKIAAKLPFWVKAPTGLAFMRSAMNMVQNASDYMPGIGAVSALRGKMGSLPENHPLHRFGMDIPLEERRMIWAAQGASLGIAAIAAAMFLGDDDDEGLEISGSWKGLTPQKKSQLMDLGERPNSIRFGKKGPWISFKQMPFAPPLAMIGTMRDQERFNDKSWDAESVADKLTAAWLGGILYIKDISSLSGVAGLFDLNAWSTQESPTKLKEKANKLAAQSVGRAAAGYIPSVIKEIDEFGDQTLYRPSKDEMSGWWIRNVPYARRTVGPGPALNNFGEPIQLTPPPIKSWAGFGKDTDLYNALGQLASRGVFTPEPGRSAKIVDDQGVYRDMTENEWYEFVKKRGPMFKEAIEANLEILKEGSSKESIEMLRDMSEKASAAARLDMFPLSRYRSLRKEQEQ